MCFFFVVERVYLEIYIAVLLNSHYPTPKYLAGIEPQPGFKIKEQNLFFLFLFCIAITFISS
jgi:hypothetical protein